MFLVSPLVFLDYWPIILLKIRKDVFTLQPTTNGGSGVRPSSFLHCSWLLRLKKFIQVFETPNTFTSHSNSTFLPADAPQPDVSECHAVLSFCSCCLLLSADGSLSSPDVKILCLLRATRHPSPAAHCVTKHLFTDMLKKGLHTGSFLLGWWCDCKHRPEQERCSCLVCGCRPPSNR